MTDCNSNDKDSDLPECMARRNMMIASAVGATATANLVIPQMSFAATGENSGGYPSLPIIKVGDLVDGEPVAFNYPLKEQPNMIVKLGTPAQGGVGPDKDIVAFSVLCTHMGGSLRGKYQHDSKAMGPCPFHFSTFDLTKGGGPVHASATQNLPQVRLVIKGDEIFAEGMQGLVYGYRHNMKDGNSVISEV